MRISKEEVKIIKSVKINDNVIINLMIKGVKNSDLEEISVFRKRRSSYVGVN